MATYSFLVSSSLISILSDFKLGRHQTRPWTQSDIFKRLLDYTDDTQLANVNIEFLRLFPCFALRILTAHNLWRH